MASNTAAAKAAPAKAPAAAPAPVAKVLKASEHVEKKELSTNNYIAAVAAAALVVVLICGVLAKSLIGGLILNQKVISKKNTANHQLDQKLQDIPQLLDNYKNLGYRKNLILHGLPTSEDFPQIVSIMQAMSSSSGVQLSSVDPAGGSAATTATTATTPAASGAAPAATTSTSDASPQPYAFTATVAGSYAHVVQFFKALEQSARPMKVVSTNFKGDSGNVSVEIQIQTYYQPVASIDDQMETVK